MYCWHCGFSTPDPFQGKVSFRETCDKCGSALHCCQNCKYYKPRLANDCAVPGTDSVSDRQANNFCEEFSLLGKPPVPSNHEAAKKRFEDLFC
ncbi:conserved hypothetical protein [Candidatus Protochlamydia naegleriophila]|uniref:Uncharacterized protein n=1 Tax=Candidatus Protochlamydia naegleriophila TaxID=389348 RepID=A0A0U5JCD5_9BACT|nr:hypothetical protein [Candidatus Protochlamydia naegleriophila]CUI16322.1 conserved hypothetical protein [Candidatus Protochlamydia naegleriophila]